MHSIICVVLAVTMTRRTVAKKNPKSASIDEELRFPQLPDASPKPTLITNINGLIYYVNPAWEKLTGYRFVEVVGKNPKFLNSGQTPKNIYTRLWRSLNAGKSFTTEDIIDKTKKGKFYQVRSVFYPVKKNGKNIFFVQVIEDITKRKKLEQLLKESEHRYKSLIRNASDGILLFDTSTRIIEANKSVCKMLGYKQKELLGRLVTEIAQPEDIAETPPRVKEMLERKALVTERNFVHKDGHIVRVELSNKLVDKNIIETIVRDVTAKKELEKQKDTFIGIAAHELKTPVTTIKAYTQILKMKLSKKEYEDLVKIANQMDFQVTRLTHLINDLLNVNKIQSGRFPLYKDKYDLTATIQKVVESLQTTHKSHKIIFKKKSDVKTHFDENRISQVLINLITNGIKYSSENDEVLIDVKKDNNDILVSIKDFGYGIDKKDQKKIFDLFYRTKDKEQSKISGFGLGLFITSEIIKKYKGKLWVESEKGKGSTFYFTLPLH